ncbi:MAG TPA: tripartite tricarboxylate transporter substrate binding protein [Burkholderiales bacterium]|nr:tripartite tricarboxylate transporter substrate binding protein [Burkholderiales bacterium]
MALHSDPRGTELPAVAEARARMRRALAAALGCFLAVTLAGAQGAEAYPSRPVRIIVQSPPGGSPDILARITAAKLSEQLKQQFVVDNRAGGSGIIGVEIAKRSAPDGYTLLLMTFTNFASLPALKEKLPYDADRDFIPLSRIAWVANVMTVHPGLGVNSIADLVKVAKARPGQLNYGSAGNGSPAHLAGEMLNVLASVKTTHVPYKGAAPAMTDLIGGQLQFLITSPLVAMPHARAGRVKVLATTGAQRDPLLPELPVVADTVPGYEIVQWWGLGVPAGTPQAIVKTLHAELMKALNDAQAREAMSKNGATAKPESQAEFAAFIKAERERIARIGKQAKISVD